jgi:hypothetical protein
VSISWVVCQASTVHKYSMYRPIMCTVNTVVALFVYKHTIVYFHCENYFTGLETNVLLLKEHANFGPKCICIIVVKGIQFVLHRTKPTGAIS